MPRGVVPVIKLSNPERDAAPLAKALCAGGVPVAEVTFRAAGADRAEAMIPAPARDKTKTSSPASVRSSPEEVLSISASGRYLAVLYADRLAVYNPDLQPYASLPGPQNPEACQHRHGDGIYYNRCRQTFLPLPM